MSLDVIGVECFFNSDVKEATCVLKQTALDFVVQEITWSRTCGVSPTMNYDMFLNAREKARGADMEADKEQRTDLHRLLKYYPFAKAKTVDGRIRLVESDEDVYSFVLQKMMFNTMDAGKWICRRVEVPVTCFQSAGNKDKRAVTFQEVTVKCSFRKLYGLALELNGQKDSFEWEQFIEEGHNRESIDETNAGAESDESLQVERPLVEWNGEERLRSSIKIFDIKKSSSRKMGDLRGNRFTVMLRGLEEKSLVQNMERGFLNYFGQQRFGNRLTNHEVGRCILEKDYEGAVEGIMRNSRCYEMYAAGRFEEGLELGDSTEKYVLRCRMKGMKDRDVVFGLHRELLMLYLHSYQSFRFNQAVSERIRRGRAVVKGDLVAVDDEVREVESPEDFTIFDVVLRLERMDNKMLKGGYRRLVERAQDVVAESCTDGVVVGFSLNSSCYATMALREVIGNAVLNRETIKI